MLGKVNPPTVFLELQMRKIVLDFDPRFFLGSI